MQTLEFEAEVIITYRRKVRVMVPQTRTPDKQHLAARWVAIDKALRRLPSHAENHRIEVVSMREV